MQADSLCCHDAMEQQTLELLQQLTWHLGASWNIVQMSKIACLIYWSCKRALVVLIIRKWYDQYLLKRRHCVAALCYRHCTVKRLLACIVGALDCVSEACKWQYTSW